MEKRKFFQAMEQLRSTNQSPKEIAMQMAKQRGINPEQMMQIARKMGIK